ncbi:MAG: acyl-CoA thioesterase [Bacteroidota bacterium]
MTLQNIVESKAKIRFQDCDPFNHLNNGKYIDYFVNHREDQLIKHYDIDIYEMAKTQGKSWVTGSNQIAYLKPALLMETVAIESQLIHYDNTSLRVEMRMYDEHKSHLKSIIWCTFVHFNLMKQKREQHTEDLMHLFSTIQLPVSSSIFEHRLHEIRQYEKSKAI